MLEVCDLQKSFGAIKALADCSFTVKPGEIFGFVGSNGAGKSTAMRIILGVLAPDGGQVTWQGQELTTAMRRRIGYMPEERGLYPKMKVGEQLIYLARLYGLNPAEAKAQMEYWTQKLGIAARREDAVEKLSLGNQQRVQLAAALIGNPEILVLDEPFSGLDPVAVDTMQAALRELANQGVPVLFSSHQLDLVERICDRVGIIRAGHMVAIGTIAELVKTDIPRYRLSVAAPADAVKATIAALPGVEILEEASANIPAYLRLDDCTSLIVQTHDEQALWQAAAGVGKVRELAMDHLTLVEKFRDVVQADAPSPAPGPETKKRRSLFGRKKEVAA